MELFLNPALAIHDPPPGRHGDKFAGCPPGLVAAWQEHWPDFLFSWYA
jgi:hypothetical protein